MPQKRMILHTLSIGLALSAAAAAARPALAAKDGPMSAPDTIHSLKMADGLEATVWAAEPQLVNPTNIDIDAKGRIWVLEAANYRRFHYRPEGDRILILEDTKGSGYCDSVKVFYQSPSLFAPLGISVIGDKVYVAQSPDVMVFDIDSSGDKPKGPPKMLFTGFGGVNHDHGVHSGVFGPDGEYYFNCGNAGGEGYLKYVKDTVNGKPEAGAPVVDTLGSEIGNGAQRFRGKPKKEGEDGYTDGYAFRCDPDGKNFETLGYNFRNNYELAVDSFGTVWQSDNDDDGNEGVCVNYVMEGGNFGYKGPHGTSWGRDMGIIPGQTRQQAHWHQLWPGIVPNLLNTGGGSPTGICVYEGDLFGKKYNGALIHADAGPNVIRAYMTHPSQEVPVGIMGHPNAYGGENKPGAGYKADVVEMAKASDRWFRPSDVCVAPDGAIYVADWYDPGVGGHNMQDAEKSKNWHKLHGRIYRIAPTGYKPTPIKLDLETVPGQIAALKSPNVATRALAWMKLHAGGAPAIAALEQMYQSDSNPRYRARALWLLARSPEGQKYVETALKDADPDIRITALRAARLIKMDMIAVANQLISDPSIQVERELCLAMNFEPADKAVPVLVKLADRYDGTDRWYLEAFGIGATGKEAEVLSAWEKDHQNKNAQVEKNIVWRLKREAPIGAKESAEQSKGKHADASSGRVAGPFGVATATSHH